MRNLSDLLEFEVPRPKAVAIAFPMPNNPLLSCYVCSTSHLKVCAAHLFEETDLQIYASGFQHEAQSSALTQEGLC